MDKSIEAMGKRPIFPLLLSMSFPPMLSMLIQSMYNIIDSIFVQGWEEVSDSSISCLPASESGPFCGSRTGVGLNALMARNLGAGDVKKAEDAAAHGIVLTTIHSAFVLIDCFD
ncbi:MAG: MATE family efflux transporter [[Clostridium] scindens]